MIGLVAVEGFIALQVGIAYLIACYAAGKFLTPHNWLFEEREDGK